jgi:uncharacterized protein YciI
MVEGVIKNADAMDDAKLQEHIGYTQKAVDAGLYLLSGLKEDGSGGIFIIKGETSEEIKEYLSKEPFFAAGIQDYKITEFTPHYINEAPDGWQ